MMMIVMIVVILFCLISLFSVSYRSRLFSFPNPFPPCTHENDRVQQLQQEKDAVSLPSLL